MMNAAEMVIHYISTAEIQYCIFARDSIIKVLRSGIISKYRKKLQEQLDLIRKSLYSVKK